MSRSFRRQKRRANRSSACINAVVFMLPNWEKLAKMTRNPQNPKKTEENLWKLGFCH
jgi:hypothetical protein